MEYFVTSQPELQPLVDKVNKNIEKKGYCTMDDLTGNGDKLHGIMFRTQEEADEFKDAFKVFFPERSSEWKKY